MGTNYYWVSKKPCSLCQRPFEKLHIGKGSYGWAFSLRIYPERGINNLDDWIKNFYDPDSYIFSEYNDEIGSLEMLNIITNRDHPLGLSYPSDYDINATRGEGTYDYVHGEFS